MDKTSEKLISELLEKAFGTKISIASELKKIPEEHRLFVLSGKKGHPRWILPSNPRWGMKVISQWQPFGLASRIKWQIFKVLYLAGLASLLPNVLLIGIHKERNSWDHLGRNGSEELVPVIYVGTPSSISKLVLTMVNKANKQPEFVAKIPVGQSAARNIMNESAVLEILDTEKPTLAPRVLYKSINTGIATQTFIKARQAKPELTERHIQLLLSFKQKESKSAEILISCLRQRIESSVNDHKQRSGALARLDLLMQQHQQTGLPVMWVHGDFCPWNIYLKDNSLLTLLDWEDAKPDGTPLYDLAHYHLIQAYIGNHSPNVFDLFINKPLVQDYVRQLGLSPATCHMLYIWYLLDFWCRHWEQGDVHHANLFYNYAHTVWEKTL